MNITQKFNFDKDRLFESANLKQEYRVGEEPGEKMKSLNNVDQRQVGDEVLHQVQMTLLRDQEDSPEIQDDTLQEQLERLWKTDFGGPVVETKPCPSVEDKKALEIMERSLKKINGHYQVALPWRIWLPTEFA